MSVSVCLGLPPRSTSYTYSQRTCCVVCRAPTHRLQQESISERGDMSSRDIRYTDIDALRTPTYQFHVVQQHAHGPLDSRAALNYKAPRAPHAQRKSYPQHQDRAGTERVRRNSKAGPTLGRPQPLCRMADSCERNHRSCSHCGGLLARIAHSKRSCKTLWDNLFFGGGPSGRA